MVFNTTSNDMSSISWISVVLFEENGVSEVNRRPAVSHVNMLEIAIKEKVSYFGYINHIFISQISHYDVLKILVSSINRTFTNGRRIIISIH